jgi:hypothetical protein
MKCNIPAYLQFLGSLMRGKRTVSKTTRIAVVRIGSIPSRPPPFISQYSHYAYATSLSLSLSFFSVMRGEEPILTRVNKSCIFDIPSCSMSPRVSSGDRGREPTGWRPSHTPPPFFHSGASLEKHSCQYFANNEWWVCETYFQI